MSKYLAVTADPSSVAVDVLFIPVAGTDDGLTDLPWADAASRGEIARARVLYEQRVPTHIRQHTDYFHDELIRTLANGDSSLLHLS